MIVIDCLQLIMLFGNAREKISEIIDTLKKFARELNVIVILTSQLSRKEIYRKSHRPILSNLEYEKLSDYADIILLLYDDTKYNTDSKEKDILEIIIAKNIDKKLGTVKISKKDIFEFKKES